MALILVILVATLCAIFEFSWAFYNYSYLYNSVTKAARLGVPQGIYASGSARNSAISAAITGAAGGLSIASPTITVKTPAGSAVSSTDTTTGNVLTVTASIDYSSLTPISSLVSMTGFSTLTASCSARME